MAREQGSFCLLPVSDTCPVCAGPWQRIPHHTHHYLHTRHCRDCHNVCDRYRIRLYFDRNHNQFSFHNGRPIRTVEQAIAAASHIWQALKNGSFDRRNYEKRALDISTTFQDLVSTIPNKSKIFSIEEEEILEDYITPHLADVGVFTLSKIHLNQFIRTFNWRGERRELAERVFDKVLVHVQM